MRSATRVLSALIIGVLLFGCCGLTGGQQNETERNASIQRQLQAQYPAVVDRCSNQTDWGLAGCVAEVAKEQDDWKQCLSLPMLNMQPGVCECITQFSVKAGNASLCEQCSMPKEKGYCMAMVTGDWTECQKIACDFSCSFEGEQTQKDLCTQWIAINKRNATICGQIQNEQYRDQCLDIAGRTGKN
jgi:hypothetical protein